MEYAFEFGGFPEDVLVTVSGVGRVGPFGRLFEELTESPQFEPGMRILLDLTHVDMTTFPGVDAPEIGRGLEKLQERCDGCSIAVVGDDPLTRSLIEMAELGSSSGMDVFRALSRAEAAAWLQLKRALTERQTFSAEAEVPLPEAGPGDRPDAAPAQSPAAGEAPGRGCFLGGVEIGRPRTAASQMPLN